MPHILISGCSGGGKSSLLHAVGAKGYRIITEPGRRIIAAASTDTDKKLPWIDMKTFAQAAFDMALSDINSVLDVSENVFFDRGVIDAAVAIQTASGTPYVKMLGGKQYYTKTVFFAPPWPEIFEQDDARRHGFQDAVKECHRLEIALDDLGYDISVLPKAPVQDRVSFVLGRLASGAF